MSGPIEQGPQTGADGLPVGRRMTTETHLGCHRRVQAFLESVFDEWEGADSIDQDELASDFRRVAVFMAGEASRVGLELEAHDLLVHSVRLWDHETRGPA